MIISLLCLLARLGGQRDRRNFIDVLHQVKANLLADWLRHVLEVFFVAFG